MTCDTQYTQDVKAPFGSARRWLGVYLRLDRQDHMQWISYVSVGGLLVAGALGVIGNSPITILMPTHALGLVEPSCGLTRGATAIARGDFALAWRYNPASFLVISFGLFGAIRLAMGLIAHRWVNIWAQPSTWGWILIGASIFALWINQQTNAEFIINSRF